MKRIAMFALMACSLVGLLTACGGPAESKKVKDLNEKQAQQVCEKLQEYGECELDGGLTLNPPDDCEENAEKVTDIPDSCELTVGDYYECYDKCSQSACEKLFSEKCTQQSGS